MSSLSVTTSQKPSPNLPVAGIIPFSATDWPGRLTVTAFTQGCPLRCSYCHNPSLQEFTPAPHDFSEVLDLLRARHGLIDALVISGGEPLACAGLGEAIAAAHEIGFPVGLHTSGYVPARLGSILADSATRPDWIGFDVKALPEHLPSVAGVTSVVAARMWESLDIVCTAAREHGMGLQLRTTLWPGSVIEQNIDQLQDAAAQRGHALVLQWARGVDADGVYSA